MESDSGSNGESNGMFRSSVTGFETEVPCTATELDGDRDGIDDDHNDDDGDDQARGYAQDRRERDPAALIGTDTGIGDANRSDDPLIVRKPAERRLSAGNGEREHADTAPGELEVELADSGSEERDIATDDGDSTSDSDSAVDGDSTGRLVEAVGTCRI